MNNLIRYYNQNRKKIWIAILVIVFLLVMIQLYNNYYKYQNELNIANNNVTENTTKDYTNESQAMVQGSITSKGKQNEFGELVEEFLTYCVDGNPSEAYKLLSNDCKEKLYPTEETFETNYYSTKFDSKKNYDFQLWSAVDRTYVYLVRIYDDMLSTGVASTQNYIQDYLSVIQEDNVYRVNISGYVKTTRYDNTNQEEKDGINISVESVDTYMDYETYNYTVNNTTDNPILLDGDTSLNNIYITDDKENKLGINSLELNESDLVIEAKSTKEFNIRFLRSYSTQTKVKEICFDKIIKNYNEFLNNRDIYQDMIEMKVQL